jgi:competence protein ComEA
MTETKLHPAHAQTEQNDHPHRQRAPHRRRRRGRAGATLAAGALVAALTAGLAAGAPPAEAARRGRGAKITGKVNLNTANTRQLTLLPRVGKKTAQAIQAYRAKRRFRTIREIIQVKGIGKRTFLRLKPHLTVRGPNTIRKKGRSKRGRRSRGSGSKRGARR